MKLEHNSCMNNDKKVNAEILEGVESWMSCFTFCCLHAQDKTLPLGDETAAFRQTLNPRLTPPHPTRKVCGIVASGRMGKGSG
jgi:hypothetical protein